MTKIFHFDVKNIVQLLKAAKVKQYFSFSCVVLQLTSKCKIYVTVQGAILRYRVHIELSLDELARECHNNGLDGEMCESSLMV